VINSRRDIAGSIHPGHTGHFVDGADSDLAAVFGDMLTASITNTSGVVDIVP
jgi:hypothetical protein